MKILYRAAGIGYDIVCNISISGFVLCLEDNIVAVPETSGERNYAVAGKFSVHLRPV